jgi:alpha-N-arabinofuranosidase
VFKQHFTMKKIYLLVLLLITIIIGCAKQGQKANHLQVSSLQEAGSISDLLYGHFYEHIYHSANGGLWGDLVWNRTFEEFLHRPEWSVKGGVISQKALLSDVRLIFGDPSWTDYEFTLEARKDGGYEGFLILFRAADEENFYWMNLGGWGNSQHALEKEVKGRREVVTDFVKGSVAENKWMPIKVKVTGNRIEVFMNGEAILNYSDSNQPLLAGGIGIGSWGTAVSYRNLKVTSGDGKILYQAMPSVPDNRSFPRHWTPSDPDRITVDKGNALNGEISVCLNPGTEPVSIAQEKFGAKPGDTLEGSVWLRGNPDASVLFRIQDQTGTLSEYTITGVTKEWREFPVSLVYPAKTGASTQPSPTLTITSTDQVWIDQVSLMPLSFKRNQGFRTDLYEAVAGIQPTVIRWPGGCYAELYRWKSGIGKQHERQVFPTNIWDDRDVNSLGTDEFITLCRKLNSEPLMVINSGFHEGAGDPEAWKPWLQEALEWLEYCNGPADSKWGSVRAANGHPEPYKVKFWEIDNELWRSRVPDPHKYSQAVRIFAEAMKKADPTITILAHGGNGTDMEWNQVVLDEAAESFDILSIHHYSDPNGYYWAALDQDSLYDKLRVSVAACRNPKIKIYVSEWNAQSTDWRTGLYAGNLLNVFENNSDIVTMGGPALFLRHVTANAWDNAFINFDEKGWFPAPNYVVMKLWKEHFAPVKLDLAGVPDSVTASASFDPAANRLVIKLVNNRHAELDLTAGLPSEYKGKNATGWLVSAPALSARNTMDEPANIQPVAQEMQITRKKISVHLPPLSCMLIEVK